MTLMRQIFTNFLFIRLIRVICVPIFILQISFNSFAQKPKAFFSRVIDDSTKRGLPAATVFNKKSKAITISNNSGEFMIWASRGDSIEITSIGYKSITFACKFLDTTLHAKQDSRMLQAVIIRAKRDEKLKEEIKQFLKDPDAALAMKKKALSNLIDVRPSSSGTPGLAISIDAIWELFSKEGKSRRKLAALEQKDYKEYLIKARYSPQFVKSITNLKEEEIDVFMKFCDFTDDFILRATDYELTFAILQNKKLFKNE